jgi:CDP-glycerol glycerophosphotransferase (TagB/SpsB family)
VDRASRAPIKQYLFCFTRYFLERLRPEVQAPWLFLFLKAKFSQRSDFLFSTCCIRLRQEKTEVVEVLKHEPIKDLRKAIGINDRFVFINDLFRGDEAMYERSIKTINSFHIFPEAEYWINRELVVKLGWDKESEIVKHFIHLVKRRFISI